MAFLQLSSTNPNFSYILKKNPVSGMLIKPNRKGRLFAWYNGPNVFNIYFRDSDMEVSYSGEDFEYMDVTRYNAPMFLINAFSEFLNHMKKVDDKDITGYEHILMINQMRCKSGSIDRFKSHFIDLGYEFKFDEVAFRNYRIEIKTKNTLRELVNLGQIFAIFNSLLNNDLEIISDNDIDKYVNCLQVIDSPYYIRHLFKLYFMKTQKIFNKYKPLIEKSEKDKIEFEFGSTLTQRIYAIMKHLDFKYPIIDIGCGTGDYVREFAPKLGELEYHAIDIAPERIEAVKRLCVRKKIENVVLWLSVDEFISVGNFPNNANIIMTEVVEHMTKDDAAVLIDKVLRWQFKSVIITTPNKTFNSNYQLLEEDMRNEDHVFEMTKKEFVVWIEELVSRHNCQTKFFEIGDNVNGLRPTLAVIIKANDKKEV
jgi:2-polyprenyl-3-methyl-5-hydroxy-6-metoxy-1,4-benzoquinol methylase